MFFFFLHLIKFCNQIVYLQMNSSTQKVPLVSDKKLNTLIWVLNVIILWMDDKKLMMFNTFFFLTAGQYPGKKRYLIVFRTEVDLGPGPRRGQVTWYTLYHDINFIYQILSYIMSSLSDWDYLSIYFMTL